MAVERNPAKGTNAPGINQSGFVCGSAKVALVASASSDDLGKFVHGALKAGTNMLTDGWAGYSGSESHVKHEPETQGNLKNAAVFLPTAHMLISNLKSWLNGTFHGVSKKHLPGYLMEWNYRFNRRNLTSNLFDYAIMRLMIKKPITYKQVISGFSFA